MKKSKARKPEIILAGDIGGTKAHLGMFEITGGLLRLTSEKIYPSRNYESLIDILKEFTKGQTKVSSACMGVPGPVTRETVMTTNLPWRVNTPSLRKALKTKKVEVINDLVANAYGISALKKKDLEVLNVGKQTGGNRALISAGTGLGEAVLFWDGKHHMPSPSEGGHAEFGPRTPLEIELLQFFSRHFAHVSYERILSGEGLFLIYKFLKESERSGDEPSWLSEKMKQEDPAGIISEMARLGESELCMEALDLFVSIYGSAAGNLALQVMAVGGIFVGGGIAPKIIWKLKEGTFMKAFRDKGRLSHVVTDIPVKVIMNERTALLGAASRALELLKAQ